MSIANFIPNATSVEYKEGGLEHRMAQGIIQYILIFSANPIFLMNQCVERISNLGEKFPLFF